MRRSFALALVTALAVLATGPADAAVSTKAATKTFDVPLPDGGGQTFAVVTIQGKAKGAGEPAITMTVGNPQEISPDIRMAGAVTAATTKKGKTTVKALVAINSLAAPAVQPAGFSSQSGNQTAGSLEVIVGAPKGSRFVRYVKQSSPESAPFCFLVTSQPAPSRYIALGTFPSPPEAIFENVKVDGGCG
jgi:hypothetical protein